MALEHIRMAEHHFQESGMREWAERMHRQADEIRERIHTALEETPRRGGSAMEQTREPRDEQQWIRQSLQELREENLRLREMMRELMERTNDRNR
jgi:DNA-binding ferritin-like protein